MKTFNMVFICDNIIIYSNYLFVSDHRKTSETIRNDKYDENSHIRIFSHVLHRICAHLLDVHPNVLFKM